jgi:hypothetical protein
MNMRTPPGDRVTGSAPVPERTWHSRARFHGTTTLNVEQTDGGDLGVQLWAVDGDGDSVRVLLDLTQIEELAADLLRRALLISRRAESERSDR